ncbi:MAG: ABC transporter ATP-binding protein [Patescibacteria group bacterium]|nr:ABC transporter ATP-binding protein [Patescibacteria group bacterium]
MTKKIKPSSTLKETIKIYWQHCRKYKLAGIIVIASSALGAVIAPITPIFYKKFFDVFSLNISNAYQVLLETLAIIALLGVIEKIFSLALFRSIVKFENDTMIDLSNFCFKKIHEHSFSYFNNSFSGAIVKKVNYFTRSFEIIIDNIFFQILPAFLTITAITGILIFKNIYLGTVILVWLIIFIIFNLKVTKIRAKYDVDRNEAESKATADLSDTIVNHNNIRLFNGFSNELKHFKELNETIRRLRRKSWDIHTNFDFITTVFSLFLNIVLMYVGIRLWQKGQFTIGDFVLLQAYAGLVINKTAWLGNVARRTYQSFTDAAEMTEILNTPAEITDIINAKKLKIGLGEIIFQDVTFYYNQTRKILNNLNLKIEAGEKLALIGPSGGGKTTTINLLLRNYDISSGKILIDGQNIAKVTMESLRKEISLVPQDPILFHRSLKENIAYGRPEASEEEILEASKLANCHDFISNLSEGYETLVGERGVKLSGGERQRVAIARAILRNAPILILDEATSSLDSASEELIQEALNRLMKNKTVIVIAHRLSTIKKMDRIICLDETGIVETGKHEELIEKKDSLYRQLWEKQSAGFLTNG